MSDLARQIAALPPSNEPLRVAIRRLRWFRGAFRRSLDQLGADLGCEFLIDDHRLTGAFVRWLRKAEAQKPRTPDQRRAFFEFAAGLMLRELVADMPVSLSAPPRKAPKDSAAEFWPEGYACTMFCLAVAAAALDQEFDVDLIPTGDLDDLRHWWSFRENARSDPRFAMGFLDMAMGRDPDWLLPEVFAHRLSREIAEA